jgi:hypothetical protein
MNNSPFKIVWVKAVIAFLIPFLSGMGGAMAQYTLTGLPPHWKIIAIVFLCSSLVAGLSALSSYLSTSFAEHKAKVEAGNADDSPAPITGAQVKAQTFGTAMGQKPPPAPIAGSGQGLAGSADDTTPPLR